MAERSGNSAFVVALGTAQDGGLPQLGSMSEPSIAARRDPSRRRRVASLLVVDPATGGRWLIDASPDIREQTEMAEVHAPRMTRESERPPLYDALFLTHAHMGHYTGLMHFGREAYNANALPVYGTPRMVRFLRENAPWEQLVSLGNVRLETLTPEGWVELAPGLRIMPVWVPHRSEYTDTVGFHIEGPERSLLYIPDIDAWEAWEHSIEEAIAAVDIAMLDATFFDGSELPGRDIQEVHHPFLRDSVERFRGLPEEVRRKVVFTHLNHTNPASDPQSAAAEFVVSAGMSIAEDGQVFPL